MRLPPPLRVAPGEATLHRIAILLACAFAGGTPGAGQERTTSESIQSLLGDSTQYREAITAFQEAVKAHDAAGWPRW